MQQNQPPERSLPVTIASTHQPIGDEIVLTIRTDRAFVVELGRNTVVIFSPTEARELWLYLARHHYYFPQRGNQ